MSGQTVYTHCFLSNLILVISNTAILQRLVSGREQTGCFLVELLSVKITVSAASSQPTSFNVFQLLFRHSNLSEVGVGPMSVRWSPSSQEVGLTQLGPRQDLLPWSTQRLRCKVVYPQGRTWPSVDVENLLAKCCARSGILFCLKIILAGLSSPATVLYSHLYGFQFLLRVAVSTQDILALHRLLHCTCRTVSMSWEWWVKHPGRCKVTGERLIEESRFGSQSRCRFLPCSSFCH